MTNLYDSKWYDSEYHGEKMSVDANNPPGPDVHADRDRAFFREMGLGPGKRILECGCGGCGGLWLMANEFGCDRLAAFDFSRVAVEYCWRWLPQVDAKESSTRDIPWADGSFDVIVAKDFTEHLRLADYAAWIAECRRLLRPGGLLGVLPGLTMMPEHINLIAPRSVAYHLIQSGFKVTACDSVRVLATSTMEEF